MSIIIPEDKESYVQAMIEIGYGELFSRITMDNLYGYIDWYLKYKQAKSYMEEGLSKEMSVYLLSTTNSNYPSPLYTGDLEL